MNFNATQATSVSTAKVLCATQLLLMVNGITAGNVLYASGTSYSLQYPYPYPAAYALAYSSYIRPSLVLANHLFPVARQREVNYDTSSPLATAIQSITDTPLDDAISHNAYNNNNVEDDNDDDDDDNASETPITTVAAVDTMLSEETPSNQSFPETLPPPSSSSQTALKTVASNIIPPKETPSTELGDFPLSSTPTSTSTFSIRTGAQESGEQEYYNPSLPITHTILNYKPLIQQPSTSQFYVQDGQGHYYYGYANEHSSKQEFKLLDGITRGAYNYIDAEGKLQTVSYISSDGEGFRVAATNLPQHHQHQQQTVVLAPEVNDSDYVAATKAAHLQTESKAIANANGNKSNTSNGPAVFAAVSGGSDASGDNVVSGCNHTFIFALT